MSKVEVSGFLKWLLRQQFITTLILHKNIWYTIAIDQQISEILYLIQIEISIFKMGAMRYWQTECPFHVARMYYPKKHPMDQCVLSHKAKQIAILKINS